MLLLQSRGVEARRGDLRSDSNPGNESITPPGTCRSALRQAKRSAMRSGVVRQHVKMSAGSSGLVGSCAEVSHEPRMITSSPSTGPPVPPPPASAAAPCCELVVAIMVERASMMRPALE